MILKLFRLYLLFLTSVFLIGCSQFTRDDASSMYLDGKIIVDEKEFDLIQGYYTYKDSDVEIKKLGTFNPAEAANQFETLSVEKNSKIEIVLEDKASYITCYQWNEYGEIEEVSLDETVLTVPEDEGYYIYEVVGKWKSGETTLVFDVEVE